ncbi:MAG: mechanosensitive ion channel family protein, partial [Paracoccaceae bacterium]
KLFAERLLGRGPSLLDPAMPGRAISALGRTLGTIELETAYRLKQQRVSTSRAFALLMPLALVLVAGFLLLAARRRVLDWLLRQVTPATPQSRRAAIAVGIVLARLLLPAAALAIAVVAIDQSDLLGPRGEEVLAGLARAAALVIAAAALGGAFFAPRAPVLRLSRLDDHAAVHAHRWLIALAAVVGLDRALVATGQDLGMAIEGLSLLNSVLLVPGGITLWRFIHFVAPPPAPPVAAAKAEPDEAAPDELPRPLLPGLRHALVWVARLAGVAAPLLAVAGYFAASRFVFYPLVASGGVIGVCILLFHTVRECIWRVAHPGGADRPDERRISLITLAVGFLLTLAAVPVLALIWGADATDLRALLRSFADGFAVGDMVIEPLDFIVFGLVFAVGYVITRMAQGVLATSVLPLTRLDAGGKAAVNAGVGYVGIVLAALVAISATGLDLSNLAIVAGALSVGIGFGLQNIVNNFVSGLILLIERPIKPGDWVELASGMGYVNKVNVRSTEIQTFDRAALIVPNSELISGPVTNWTHTNLNGRLIVPVGVAYGTDPRQVETILTEIAGAHPMLLRRPAPYVLFRRFGADALEFELRGVLRDVNWILNTTSDINFEIARRFEEAGIEIPFAQRDLHLRNADELGRSIAGALRGEPEPPPETPKPQAPPRRRAGPSEAAGTEPDGDA